MIGIACTAIRFFQYMYNMLYLSVEFVGMLTLQLSPMTVAPVCRVGDPLQISCTASVEFIRWSIWQANEQGTLVEVTDSVQINSLDANQMSQREVKSAAFMFMRISAEDTTPLVSTLSIDSVNISLNGTVVRCSEVGGSMTSASTTIQIIDIGELVKIFCCKFLYIYMI